MYISGMRCSLCQLLITSHQDKIGFPAFVANEIDPLHIFSDRIFHANCFYKHPLSEKALARYQESRQILEANKQIHCVVCKHENTDPDSYLYFPYLTEETNDPLHQYNHLKIHYLCLPKWSDLLKVYELLVRQQQEGAWRGRALDYLLEKMRKALTL